MKHFEKKKKYCRELAARGCWRLRGSVCVHTHWLMDAPLGTDYVLRYVTLDLPYLPGTRYENKLLVRCCPRLSLGELGEI